MIEYIIIVLDCFYFCIRICYIKYFYNMPNISIKY